MSFEFYMKKYDVIIVGAGPGGLSSGRILADAGMRVLIIERKQVIGPKVCGGGITWDGLIRRVPENLIEKSFYKQYIFSDRQSITVEESNPIIATISRERLGQFMAEQAKNAGVEILHGTHVLSVNDGTVVVNGIHTQRETLAFDHLIGADGSGSTVRKYLGIPVKLVGLGINFQIPAKSENMEWHFNSRLFGSGYSWIFPHGKTTSVGVYRIRQSGKNMISPQVLKKNLCEWAEGIGLDLTDTQARAGVVNFDYRGFQFKNNIWLVGDAAGFASGLTGEGIYPAIVSGETIAKKILDKDYDTSSLNRIIKKQKQHSSMIRLAGTSPILCSLIVESCLMALRLKLLDFSRLEMAD